MIDWNRGAHELNRTESVFWRRDHRGIQQAHADERHNHQRLRSRAKNEFRPRGSRLRQQGEEILSGGKRAHIRVHSSAIDNTRLGPKVSDAPYSDAGTAEFYSLQLKGCTAKAISLANGKSMWLIFQELTPAAPGGLRGQSKKSQKLHARLESLTPGGSVHPARDRRPVEPGSKISRHRRIERLHLFGQLVPEGTPG